MLEFKIQTRGSPARADVNPVINAFADHIDVAVIKLEGKGSPIKNIGGIRYVHRVCVVEEMLCADWQGCKPASTGDAWGDI